jgi:hypothetical protein
LTEDKTPTWQKVVAVLYVLALIAEVVIFRSRLGADFIPFDASRLAPNILASIIIVEVVTPFGALLWPPTRRRIHRFADRKLDAIHKKLDEHKAHHDAHASAFDEIRASLADLHRKHDELSAPKRKVGGNLPSGASKYDRTS